MYNGNLEWSLTIRDLQSEPDFAPGGDLLAVAEQIGAMQSAPLAESGDQYDARSIFDSRPPNAFDGQFSGSVAAVSGTAWEILFNAPLGYRVVPREWQVSYDNPGSGAIGNSTVTLLLNGSAVPYNNNIAIGPGTSDPIESFYLVEEGATFGISGESSNLPGAGTTAYVNVRVNLIPVTLDQLPFSVVNRKSGT